MGASPLLSHLEMHESRVANSPFLRFTYLKFKLNPECHLPIGYIIFCHILYATLSTEQSNELLCQIRNSSIILKICIFKASWPGLDLGIIRKPPNCCDESNI